MTEDKTKFEINCPVCKTKKPSKVYVGEDTKGFLHVVSTCPNCKNLLTYSNDLEWAVPDFDLSEPPEKKKQDTKSKSKK